MHFLERTLAFLRLDESYQDKFAKILNALLYTNEYTHLRSNYGIIVYEGDE